MNEIKVKCLFDEIISLVTPAQKADNGVLSQNLLAVTPNGLNWLFLRPNTATGAGVNPPYTHNVSILCFPLMVWLILQNKPVGEYAKRLLTEPRVRPHRPLGLLTQKTVRSIIMLNSILIKLSFFTPLESLVLGFIIGLPIACLVIGLLAVMGV